MNVIILFELKLFNLSIFNFLKYFFTCFLKPKSKRFSCFENLNMAVECLFFWFHIYKYFSFYYNGLYFLILINCKV